MLYFGEDRPLPSKHTEALQTSLNESDVVLAGTLTAQKLFSKKEEWIFSLVIVEFVTAL